MKIHRLHNDYSFRYEGVGRKESKDADDSNRGTDTAKVEKDERPAGKEESPEAKKGKGQAKGKLDKEEKEEAD